MRNLWQALRAGGSFISLLSTKSPLLSCSTFLPLFCTLTVLYPCCILFYRLLLPLPIHKLTFPTQPLIISPVLALSDLPPTPPNSWMSLWLCGFSESTFVPLFLSLILVSLLYCTPPPPCPPPYIHWSVSVYHAYTLCFPNSRPIYTPTAFHNTRGLLISGISPCSPTSFQCFATSSSSSLLQLSEPPPCCSPHQSLPPLGEKHGT